MRAIYRPFDEDYIRFRYELFKLTTLKSLEGQSDREFEIVLVSDKDVPEDVLKDQNKIQNCRTLLVDGVTFTDHKNYSNILGNLLRSIAPEGMIISTNVDSDDMLRQDYVGKVRSISNTVRDEDTPLLISMEKILKWFPGKEVKETLKSSLQREGYTYPSYSVVESSNTLKTCLATGHGQIGGCCKSRIPIEIPFLMLSHGANVCTVHTGRRVEEDRLKALKYFGINSECVSAICDLHAKYEKKGLFNREKQYDWRNSVDRNGLR